MEAGNIMTGSTVRPQPENVISGALLALLALPVGVIVLALISSIGFVASIVGYLIAFAAVWLYRRGSGGVISRVGAWVITGVVVLTLLVGIWVSLVVTYAGGVGHLGLIGDARFWPLFNEHFSDLVGENVLFIILVLAFGVLGSFRVLGRAFATARLHESGATAYGNPTTLPPAPTTYHDDIDAAPTGSADDKTKPPTSGT
jgi:hypothetical protein